MGESPHKKRFEITRQGNFILAILLIFFVFFGYLCNIAEKSIGLRIIFLYQALFGLDTFPSFIILIVILFIMVVREPFWEYGLRNSIWLTPIIMGFSWFWYIMINEFNFQTIFTMISSLMTLSQFLFEVFSTAIILLGINFSVAVIAIISKMKYVQNPRRNITL